jgi:glycosyltransferase involved in cell wall biosynthesis
MKILHINQSDIYGNGAGIAAYRQHQGLLAQSIHSRLLVGILKTNSTHVASVPKNKRRIESLLYRFTSQVGLNDVNYIGSFDIHNHNFYKEADILNFHNIHSGYFSYLALPSLTATKPAVFTLHDMWSFTGHCCYSHDCERWKVGCGKCPYLDTYPAVKRDNTSVEWNLKKWIYSRSNLTFVTNSSWLVEQAKQSMLINFPIHYIPQGIDTEAYQPLEKEQCRALLGIPPGKKVLMFASLDLTYPRKGGDLLLKALKSLPESLKDEIVLLTIGNGGEAISQAIEMPNLYLGFLSSDRLKSIAYSAADLFLFPTRADIFGLVAQEAAACGTPTVSFNVGGVPDIVRPGVTGYLARPEDANDFCSGIIQLLEDEALRKQMGQNCRGIVLEEYSLELQAKRYIELYHKVLEK